MDYLLFGVLYLFIGGFLAGLVDNLLEDYGSSLLIITLWPLVIVSVIVVYLVSFPVCLGKWINKKIVRHINREARLCSECIRQNTMDCPNSAECYDTTDKPHFQAE